MLGQALHIFPAACFAHPQIAGAVLIPGAVCILEDSSFTPVVLCQQISEAIRNSCRLRCLTTLETCCCSFSFLPQLCARSLTMPHTHTHTHSWQPALVGPLPLYCYTSTPKPENHGTWVITIWLIK